MTTDIKNVLVVDKSQELAERLCETYSDTLSVENLDFTNSLLNAVQSLVATDYQLCFVANHFEESELKTFISDVSGAKLPFPTFCLAVVEDSSNEELKEKYLSFGFKGVVSPKGTHADKAFVADLFEEIVASEPDITEEIVSEEPVEDTAVEVAEKSPLGRGLEVAIGAIDRVAESIRRGSKHMLKLDMLARDFLRNQSNCDEDSLDEYVEELCKQTNNSAPNEVVELDIPLEVLNRQLPGLSSENYSGASHRVWSKLKEEYGLKHGEERKHEKHEVPMVRRKPKKQAKPAKERLKEKLALLGTKIDNLDDKDAK